MMERFISLAEAYGGDINRWPETVRAEAIEFASKHPECQQILEEASSLDQLLSAFAVPDHNLTNLSARISRQVKDHKVEQKSSLAEQIVTWLIPSSTSSYWRPACAACLPLLLGITIGMNMQIDQEITLDEEISIMALTNETLEVFDE